METGSEDEKHTSTEKNTDTEKDTDQGAEADTDMSTKRIVVDVHKYRIVNVGKSTRAPMRIKTHTHKHTGTNRLMANTDMDMDTVRDPHMYTNKYNCIIYMLSIHARNSSYRKCILLGLSDFVKV